MSIDPHRVFELRQYIARKKLLTVFGGRFTIHDPETGEVVASCRQRAFKLREDIRVYADPNHAEEILLVKARQVIDFSAAYDVTVPETGECVGTLRRKGFSSILRDRWQILDAEGAPRGEIEEDSTGMALVRRFLTNLIPQSFTVRMDGFVVGQIRQFFNPFILKVRVDLSPDTGELLDRRVALAAVILLLAIEGRQN
jgi:hypothetical protein